MATEVLDGVEQSPEKKKLARRSAPDRSQRIRHMAQVFFVLLNVWIGAQFYLWVRFYELGGQGPALARPAGVEGWLPIAGLMNAKAFFLTGHVPIIHPAAMFLFMAFMLMSWLLKKAFCAWLCPVGTLSEALWKLGRRLFGRTLQLPLALPKALDIPLRSLKYVLLGFFLLIVGGMPVESLNSFMATPYGLIADVKMLDFFRGLDVTAIVVLGILVLGSMAVQNFWCRYLCPYGAFMGLVSLLSPARMRRDREACIGCGKCAQACPAHLPVDQLVQIRSVECTACMECVAVCPAEHALQLALPPRRNTALAQRWFRRSLSPLAVAGLLATLFFGFVLVARATHHWRSPIPDDMYRYLIPNAGEVTH